MWERLWLYLQWLIGQTHSVGNILQYAIDSQNESTNIQFISAIVDVIPVFYIVTMYQQSIQSHRSNQVLLLPFTSHSFIHEFCILPILLLFRFLSDHRVAMAAKQACFCGFFWWVFASIASEKKNSSVSRWFQYESYWFVCSQPNCLKLILCTIW